MSRLGMSCSLTKEVAFSRTLRASDWPRRRPPVPLFQVQSFEFADPTTGSVAAESMVSESSWRLSADVAPSFGYKLSNPDSSHQ